MGNPPTSIYPIENIANETFNYAIRATATLYYWFALETGQIINGGVISNNTTWSGHINVIGSTTISSGGTLNISPGSVILFRNGSKLIVSGSGNLQANGNINDRITFDFISRNSSTQNGLHLSTGTVSLKYCDIKNAHRGVYIIYSNPVTIQNCNITYNTFGIYQAYGSSSNSIIDQNIIKYNYSDGIYIQESTPPKMTKNTIANNGRHGIYIT